MTETVCILAPNGPKAIVCRVRAQDRKGLPPRPGGPEVKEPPAVPDGNHNTGSLTPPVNQASAARYEFWITYPIYRVESGADLQGPLQPQPHEGRTRGFHAQHLAGDMETTARLTSTMSSLWEFSTEPYGPNPIDRAIMPIFDALVGRLALHEVGHKLRTTSGDVALPVSISPSDEPDRPGTWENFAIPDLEESVAGLHAQQIGVNQLGMKMARLGAARAAVTGYFLGHLDILVQLGASGMLYSEGDVRTYQEAINHNYDHEFVTGYDLWEAALLQAADPMAIASAVRAVQGVIHEGPVKEIPWIPLGEHFAFFPTWSAELWATRIHHNYGAWWRLKLPGGTAGGQVYAHRAARRPWSLRSRNFGGGIEVGGVPLARIPWSHRWLSGTLGFHLWNEPSLPNRKYVSQDRYAPNERMGHFAFRTGLRVPVTGPISVEGAIYYDDPGPAGECKPNIIMQVFFGEMRGK